jgi:hypothetical protein
MAGHQRGRRGSYPNLVWKAIATGTTFIGVGETVAGDQSAGEAVQLTVAWGQDREAMSLTRGTMTTAQRWQADLDIGFGAGLAPDNLGGHD